MSEASSRPGGRSRRYFLVDVPGLNLVFVGYEKNGKLVLIPLLDDPQRRLKARADHRGDSVFVQLVPEAQADTNRLR